jgi:hypothetical protein
VIGFVSQFFSSTSGALSSTSTLGRHSSCAADGRVGAQRQLPRAKAHGWIPSDLAVSCMTIRILRAKASWLTGAMGQEQQPLPGVASLASSRNFINTAKNDGERSRRQTGANLTRTGVWQVQAILGIRASAPKAGAAGRGGIVSRRLRSELGPGADAGVVAPAAGATGSGRPGRGERQQRVRRTPPCRPGADGGAARPRTSVAERSYPLAEHRARLPLLIAYRHPNRACEALPSTSRHREWVL